MSGIKHTRKCALACDDTMLRPALRVYHDKNGNSWQLVGTTTGLVAIVDEVQLKAILDSNALEKAKKVSTVTWFPGHLSPSYGHRSECGHYKFPFREYHPFVSH